MLIFSGCIICPSWSDKQFMNEYRLYLPLWDLLINMLSIAETDPFKLLVGNHTVPIKLYVASKASVVVVCRNFHQDSLYLYHHI